jgi:hypothetical protein
MGCASIALSLYLALEACAPGMIRAADRLRDGQQIAPYTRDAIIKLTFEACASRDSQKVKRWHSLLRNRPIPNPELREEFRRAVRRTLINLKGDH